MRSGTSCCKTLLIIVVLAMAILALPAFAQNNCLQDEYNKFTGVSDANCAKTASSNLLNCTAGDVSISQVDPASIVVLNNTVGGNTCIQGSSFNFIGDFDILTQANAVNSGGRDNVGLYFSNNLNNPKITVTNKTTSQALCGSCVDNVVSKPHLANGSSCTPSVPPSGTNTCFGSDNYHELDTGIVTSGGQADNCGDTSSTDNSPHYGAGQEGITIEVDNYPCSGATTACANDPTKQCLVMQYCTSWQIPGGVNACFSDPTQGWPYVSAATPGTKSKCNCSTVQLPITPVSITASVSKTCSTSITTAAGSTSCDEGPEGQDAATYTVTVTPTVTSGSTVVDQICDSAYGTLYDDDLLNSSNQRVFPTCPAGTVGGTLSNNTCASGMTITSGSGTCSFTAPAIGEDSKVTDTVFASMHASLSNTATVTTAPSNSVTVFSEDAPSTATVTKGFVANEAACVTVRYSVDVANTSGFDESLTLPANTSSTNTLSDNSFGDITSVHDSVLGTTCGVASGLGTLSGTAGGGALPVTIPVDASNVTNHYKCQFDAQFCGPVDGNDCISHSNTVSAALSLDTETGTVNVPPANGACTDASGNSVPCLTETKNTLTIKECLTPTVTSQ
jgi:hypothetical protein